MSLQFIFNYDEDRNAIGIAWRAVMRHLKKVKDKEGNRFDFTIEVPDVGSAVLLSIDDVNTRITALDALVKSLSGPIDISVTPAAFSERFEGALGDLEATAADFQRNLEALDSKGGVGELNLEAFQIHNPPNDYIVNCAKQLRDVNICIDQVLENYYPLAAASGSATGSSSSFDAIVSELSETLQEAREADGQLKALQVEAAEKRDDVAANGEEVEALKGTIEDLHATIEGYVSAITNRDEESTEYINSISSLNDDAGTLKASVDAYQAEFDTFGAELEGRVEKHNAAQQETERLTTELKALEDKVHEVVARSEDMMEGATNVGLATTFKTINDDLDGKVKRARTHFYWSIGVLFVSAAPLATYLFDISLGDAVAAAFDTRTMPTEAPVAAAKATTDEVAKVAKELDATTAAVDMAQSALLTVKPTIELTKTFGLALLMIPAAWLAKFTAARHHSLFRLKENYAYKYSIAMGVEGFKKQAPTYEQEIAAATFFELTFNPADKMEGDTASDRHPNPVMEWMMNKLGLTHNGKQGGAG